MKGTESENYFILSDAAIKFSDCFLRTVSDPIFRAQNMPQAQTANLVSGCEKSPHSSRLQQSGALSNKRSG